MSFGRSPLRLAIALLLALTGAAAAQQPRATPLPGTAAAPALPTTTAIVQTERVRAELVAEVASVQPGVPFHAGLRQQIIPKWHTYWRNPGDSGMPATIAWALPAGARAGDIIWPQPHRMPVGPLVNYGYETKVLLPVEIVPPAGLKPGDTFTLRADATWLVCEDVCIPEEGKFSLSLPVTATAASADVATREEFEQALRAAPIPAPWSATYAALGDKRLSIAIHAPGLRRDTLLDVYFYPQEPGPIEHSAPQKLTVSAAGLALETLRSAAAAELPRTLDGVLVIRERTAQGEASQAFTLAAALGPALPAAAAGTEEIGFVQALLFALLGGLILNLMPCVFPVLSMKALGLVQHTRSAPATLRLQGLVYAAGVLASFAAIGGAIAALRAGGETLGWGFQFQSPLFTLLLAWLFFVIGLNLSGLFVVGGRLAGVGAGLAARPGHAGAFFTGVLAAIVATPCTAPFMAAALGFAFTRPVTESIAVLLAMGAGLALPYVLLCFAPALLARLPRPGPWMVRLKQVLAFPMYASAAWLVWVLAQQAGSDGVLYALAGMLLLGFAAWAWQAAREAMRSGWRIVAIAAALLSLAGGTALAIAIGTAPPQAAASAPAAPTPDGANWERFSQVRLAELRTAGRPVFVNITAAWCITCLANERIALGTETVKRAFAEHGIAYLKGDWTNRDPEITATLQQHGRAGVPLYLFYPAGTDQSALVLPQILTESEVLAQVVPR